MRFAVVLALFTGLAGSAMAADPPFGSRGFVTKADLDKIEFGKPAKELKAEEHAYPVEGLKAALVPAKTTFKPGEPVVVYLVVKNDGEKALSPGFASELTDWRLHRGAKLSLWNLDTKAFVVNPRRILFEAARREKLTESFAPEAYFVAAFVVQDATGRINPGKYELFWNYSSLCSPKVTFTVEKPANPDDAIGNPTSSTAFLELIGEADFRKDKPGSFYNWKKTFYQGLHEPDVFASLGLGINGKFYPDVDRIPAEDDLVSATATWVYGRDRTGGRLVISLAPKDKSKTVILPYRPRVVVAQRFYGGGKELSGAAEKLLRQDPADVKDRIAPKEIVIDLPENFSLRPWDRNGGYSILISSQEFRSERDGDKPASKQKLKEGMVEWSGVLRVMPAEKEVAALEFRLNAKGELVARNGTKLADANAMEKFVKAAIEEGTVLGLVPSVVIHAAEDAKHPDLIHLLDVCVAAGARDIKLRTFKERE